MLTLPLLCLGALLALPAPAAAQDDEGASGGGGEADDGGTIVATRAPKDRRPSLVRSKFFYKAGRVEISPRFGYITSNALNNDFTLGASVTGHFSERLALEGYVAYALNGAVPCSDSTATGQPAGICNTKNLAVAVMNVMKNDAALLESVDPGFFATASLIWSPMYGKINPFGLAVINLDFYFALGLGYGNETVEMLSCPGCLGRSQIQIAQQQINHLFLLNFGFGAQVFVSDFFSLKLEGRLYVTTDEVLNFDEPEHARDNRELGVLVNRLSCDQEFADANDAPVCKTVFPTTLVLGVGGSFWTPGSKAASARKTQD